MQSHAVSYTEELAQATFKSRPCVVVVGVVFVEQQSLDHGIIFAYELNNKGSPQAGQPSDER